MKMDSKFDEEMSEYKIHGYEHDKEKEDWHKKSYKEKKHKFMTMEDVSEQLVEDFKEEIEDSKKYFCMSKVAEKANDYEDCHYLIEMAKDEYTHAYFIHDFMMEHGIEISKEQKEEFEELKEMIKEFFR